MWKITCFFWIYKLGLDCYLGHSLSRKNKTPSQWRWRSPLATHPHSKCLICGFSKVDSSRVQVRGLTVTWNQIMTIVCDYTVLGQVPWAWRDHAPAVTSDCNQLCWLGFLAELPWPLAGRPQLKGGHVFENFFVSFLTSSFFVFLLDLHLC